MCAVITDYDSYGSARLLPSLPQVFAADADTRPHSEKVGELLGEEALTHAQTGEKLISLCANFEPPPYALRPTRAEIEEDGGNVPQDFALDDPELIKLRIVDVRTAFEEYTARRAVARAEGRSVTMTAEIRNVLEAMSHRLVGILRHRTFLGRTPMTSTGWVSVKEIEEACHDLGLKVFANRCLYNMICTEILLLILFEEEG